MNRPRNFEEILAKFPDAKQSGDHRVASCPLPGHKTSAGHITLKDAEDKALITCQGGRHEYEDFCEAWGYDTLAYSDNNGHKPEPDQRKEVAIYKYQGFEVVRYEPKDFRQRRSDGNGGYIWNLDGIERTLYHQDDLPAAIEKGTTIYIPEGEKDVDRLRSLGLIATCNSGGAGKWLPQYTAVLKGADLVIVPDKDKVGYEHAQKVAQACHGTAKRVRILELPGLPDKGDVSDWLNSGGDVEKLEALVESCLAWTPLANGNAITLRCMKDVKAEPVTWLWKPYIAIGKLTLLEGDPGEGKSWITLAIATAISLGKGLPGQATMKQGHVIVLSAEDGLGDTIRPRLDTMQADLDRIHAIDGAITFDDAGFTLIENYITKVKPTLLIIDPLQAYLGAGMDFHRANETRPLLARLARLAEKYQLAILILRHLSKGGQNKAIYRGLGSIDFTAACRSVLLAGCEAEDKQNAAIVHIKSNLAKKGPSQGYQLRDDNFHWTGESSLTSTQILAGDDNTGNLSETDEAIEFLKDELADGPVPANDVYHDAEGAGISKRTLDRAKSKIRVITRRKGEKGKRGGGGWTWELPTDDLRHHGNLNKKEVENINIATDISGNLNNSEAKKLTSPKNLATLISEKIVPDEDPFDDPEPATTVLIRPRKKIIEFWVSKGRPLVHLGPGENCEGLEQLLSNEDILPRHIEAINKWFIENGGD